MKTRLFPVFLFFLITWACKNRDLNHEFSVVVINPLDTIRSTIPVFLPLKDLPENFNPKAFAVFQKTIEIPSQYNFADTTVQGIFFVINKLEGLESLEFDVRYQINDSHATSYLKRTQAELSHKQGGHWKGREYLGGSFVNVDHLRVPPQHKDHSWFIRYEGPGWESDKIAYRLYLDQRNAIDVFGKKIKELILHTVGLDGFDSYHQMQDWGMDILKVGKSLGLGSIGFCAQLPAQRVELTDSVDCSILENGCVYSSIQTNYYGWQTSSGKTNLKTHLSITAGSRLTQYKLMLSDTSVHQLCTGLIKDTNATLFTDQGNYNSFGYLATFGKQSLNNDNLGLVVFFHHSQFSGFADDEYNYLVNLKPKDGILTYYFAAVWEGEPDGIRTESDFQTYVKHTAKELAQPVIIKVKK